MTRVSEPLTVMFAACVENARALVAASSANFSNVIIIFLCGQNLVSARYGNAAGLLRDCDEMLRPACHVDGDLKSPRGNARIGKLSERWEEWNRPKEDDYHLTVVRIARTDGSKTQ